MKTYEQAKNLKEKASWLKCYADKRVFITGHTGFKGSWLALFLLKLGARVSGYALPPESSLNHFDLLQLSSKLDSTIGDINDYAMLKATLQKAKPEIIFHLAAQPLVRESYRDPLYTFRTNAIGTLNILEAARELDSLKAIVIITTDKVYDNKEWLYGYRENDRLGGYDPYSASKACAEIITDSMRRSFFNIDEYGRSHSVLIASARAGNVIGGGDWSADRLLPDLIKAATCGEITKIRNPNSTRPWQHVLEPLSGYLMLGARLLEGEKEFATAFNFGPGLSSNVSVQEVLEIAKSAWEKIAYEFEVESKAPHEAGLLMLDSTKAQKMLGWQPKTKHKEAILHTISWYREFYEKGELLSERQLEKYMELL